MSDQTTPGESAPQQPPEKVLADAPAEKPTEQSTAATGTEKQPAGATSEQPYPELKRSDLETAPPAAPEKATRNRMLPILLFVATCLSTFWVGAAKYEPVAALASTQTIWNTIQSNWLEGLTYMGAVLAILLTHEMGHFLQTVRYHIPASYPLCIPVPFNPIGTMGAVISMDGMRADRKQIFDIGIAGPLAGLAVAIPILWIGVDKLDLTTEVGVREIQLNSPLIVNWMIDHLHPEWSGKADWIGISQVNPWFMAGWVGMLITGLNMMPISQLDGGHTLYGLFGPRAHTYARGFVVVAIGYVVVNIDQAAIWTPMLILVILMGIHHPKTANDKVELDDFRWILGIASLSIPILCFPLLGLRQ
ncbi:site-2 protease family protein [Aeoliella sp. ICT_H6.2]|uniref:Site-2 protease family protein n=1 Tax=Aeoliella straminimaris TaxID=2954799 RepID=A0A9X2FBI1_9BACT|nr:site-2 protease family protein [Aeoliella straminimaris]MCO6045825.1 site-2 protease family protein [Aeoliella straminimaris]